MRTDDFDYHLPRELIAQEPAEPRDSARLMALDRQQRSIAHHRVSDLPRLLDTGDLLVVNDTRVMAARLFGVREDTGGHVEVLLVRPYTDLRWQVMLRPGRQAVAGRRFLLESSSGQLGATVLLHERDLVILEFDRRFDPATAGEVPLPPYITGYAGDPERYQTVFSRSPRSAAAPTAGLHFTDDLFARLAVAGIDAVAVTLHVGPGTFKPVTANDPREHVLHEEFVSIDAEVAAAIQRAKEEGRRIVAVGTTVVRTLEHVARERGAVEAYEGWTSLRILPGDDFLVVDRLLTNFHLPRSTLLMLVSAFAGREFVLDAYREAIERRYRFYSFGDAMLIV